MKTQSKLKLKVERKGAQPQARKYRYGKGVYIADDVHALLVECAGVTVGKRHIQHYASEQLCARLLDVRKGLVKEGLLPNNRKSRLQIPKGR